MGEDEDKFTKEEKEILGEEEETEEEETPEEKEEAKAKGEEEVKAEEEVEEEKEGEEGEEKQKGPIPYLRFDKVNKTAITLKEKLDLLKSDPEDYRKQYPEEFDEEEALEEEKTVPDSEIWNLIIQGGPHDGERLGEIFDRGGADARYALDLYNKEQDAIRAEAQATKIRQDKDKTDSDTELDTLRQSLAKDLYDKEADKISEDEKAEIKAIIDDTLTWMEDTGRGFGNIIDGYFLKNKEKLLAGEQTKGISNLIKSTQSSVISIANIKDIGSKLTGYEADMGKSAEELAAKIENMTDEKAKKYLADAPQKLKDKFPSANWG